MSCPTLALQHVTDIVICIDTDFTIRGAFMDLWIFSIHDRMNTNPYEDLSGDQYHTILRDDGDIITRKLLRIPVMFITNIILLQQWYREQGSKDHCIWFTLSKDSFIAWKAKHFHALSAPTMMSTPLNRHQKYSPRPLLMLKTYNAASKEVQLTTTNSRTIATGSSSIEKIKAKANSHGLSQVLHPHATYRRLYRAIPCAKCLHVISI
jgi:hypothetical protein